jgi:hypothetical protein
MMSCMVSLSLFSANRGVLVETLAQPGSDALPHPGFVLGTAPLGQAPTGRLQFAPGACLAPEIVQPRAPERAELQHPADRVRVRAQPAHGAGDLRPRARGSVLVEVGLVDDHQVGQFHHALLDGLQVVARVGQLHQHEQVGHAGHGGLALAHAHGFDDDDVEARGLAQQHGFTRLLGHAAQRATGRTGADEGALVHAEPLHARLVTEDAAAAQAAAGVDGQHRHAVPALHQEQAQRLDEGALAHAGNAADAQAKRAAGVGRQGVEQGVGQRPVIAARGLQQRDGLGQRAPCRGAAAGAQLCRHGGDGGQFRQVRRRVHRAAGSAGSRGGPRSGRA